MRWLQLFVTLWQQCSTQNIISSFVTGASRSIFLTAIQVRDLRSQLAQQAADSREAAAGPSPEAVAEMQVHPTTRKLVEGVPVTELVSIHMSRPRATHGASPSNSRRLSAKE